VEKFPQVIPLGPKVNTPNTVNFKPIFEFSLLKIVVYFFCFVLLFGIITIDRLIVGLIAIK